jgi:decaprenyl-phosphate phosphoribosyltransferase
MRPRQWIKNVFVLAPLLFSGEFLNSDAIRHALFAVLFFCLASSATYIVNDMCDINFDRRHPKKSKSRPLAAGYLSMRTALALLSVLYGALIWGWFISPKVMLIISVYLVLNLAYTFVLKHQPVIDIFTIAIGFVLRIFAGSIAISTNVSSWMSVTTLCLALYLAALKRRQEFSQNGNQGRLVLDKYSISLVDRYAEMSATGALMFYSMYVMSSKPQLVITIPLVLFGLFRYWYVVDTLDLGESPTDTLMADRQLLLTVVLWVVVCGWALWPVQG